MNEATIAARLLMLLASGGALERTITELPMFKAQIESAFDWMRSNCRCTRAEIEQRADRLRELIRQKDDAIKNRYFDRAASARAEECALFGSLGLPAPTGETWHTILHVGIEEQTRYLSALLIDTKGEP